MDRKQRGDQWANLLDLFWKINGCSIHENCAIMECFLPRDWIFFPSRNLKRWEILSNMSITGEFLASWVGHRYFLNIPYLHSLFYELWSIFSWSHQMWQGRGDLVHIFILPWGVSGVFSVCLFIATALFPPALPTRLLPPCYDHQ